MLLPANISLADKLAFSAATAAIHNFHWQHATLVLFNSTLLCGVNFFLRSYQKNAIVGRGTFYPKFVGRTRQYVLFGNDLPDIVQMFTWMQRHRFDNTGKFIVVCESYRQKCNEADAVRILWDFKIINVIILNGDPTNSKVNAYTYYQPEDCQHSKPVHVNNWDLCMSNENYPNCKNMFPTKMKNLHRCPIIVSTFDQVPYMNTSNGKPKGADGDVLCIIEEELNLTLVMMTPRQGTGWGKLEENGTWTGSLGDVYNDWANFSMTSGSITLSRFTSFQMSSDYNVVTVGWVTHPSQLEPSSLKLLRPFQSQARIALVLSFIVVVAFVMFLNSNFFSSLRHALRFDFPEGIICYTWEMCVGLPVSFIPTNKALLYMVLFWIWYCFLIRTFYQVCLITSLQTDIYTPEFETIEEAIASKYTFGGGMALRDYYIDNRTVYDDWVNVESNEILPTMKKLSQGFQFVLAMNLATTYDFMSQNTHNKLHILPRVIISSPTVIFFKKYTPLATSINIVLTRLREAGLIKKIYLNNTRKIITETQKDNDIPISMEHYTSCYLILLCGWALSLLCFIVEKLMPRKKR